MCSVLLLRHYEARKRPTAVSCFMTPGLQKDNSEGRARPAKLRHSKLVTYWPYLGWSFSRAEQWLRHRKLPRPFSRADCPTRHTSRHWPLRN